MTTATLELENLLIKDCFTALNTPRRTSKGNIKYNLEELIFLTLSAVVSSFQTYELGEIKIDWLGQFYPYKSGIPLENSLMYQKTWVDWRNKIAEDHSNPTENNLSTLFNRW